MDTQALFDKGLPPRIEDVKIYFTQKGMPEQEATDFFMFYERKFWTNQRGELIRRWKDVARRWIGYAISLPVQKRRL